MKWLTQLKYIILLLGLFPYNNNIAQSSDSLSSENYSQFFDSIFQNPLSKKVFRGAAFVFVKDGKIMYEKGYGYVDLKKTHKVSPLNSIFYTASVSKIFPALALMQLQQYGKCNMNDDVRKYLGEIQLHNPFHTNVRLINLVTHTAGFEDRFFNAMVKDPAYLRPLDKYFALNMPDIVMEPGTQISYSNHGAALSGLIVQLISGIPFYQFAREHIFAPLAMNHTSFMQPLPDSLGKLIKQGGNYQPYYNPYPAASCVTTADDMGKLLIALMDKTNPVFSKESLEQIFSKQWSSNKNMPGMGIGFMQSWENGQNGYYHTGDAGQHSIIFILPDKKIGFYAVYTNLTEDANNPREELTKTILNKY
ncbi:MAG TPA: serine hydrolase domain-containing protein, partial [Saprospiraceae bacterium]|nr:serine hydrolase domain-containing protein [Saprospiraceae bacterium]